MTAKLFETNSDELNGAVLVAHGLNNKAKVMDALISVLVDQGFHCLRISLHEEATGSSSVSPERIGEDWIDTMTNAYAELVERYPGSPIYNLSYSLGALVSIRFLDINHGAEFESMVLIAPPAALTWTASLVRFLTPLARFGIALPSAAPVEVRARRGTPLMEYAAMLQMLNQIQSLAEQEKLDQIQTLVVLDKNDELVSYEGVMDWLDQNNLTHWSPKQLVDRAPESRTYAHLMVIEKALGRPAWETLTRDILAQFGVEACPG